MIIKGKLEYQKFLKGIALTRKEAILAQCYVCNGCEEGGKDCGSTDCPLHQFMPYRKHKLSKRKLSDEEREKRRIRLKEWHKKRKQRKSGESSRKSL